MRLVTRKVARYDEIMRYWDLNEVLDANEMLDIEDDAEWLSAETARAQIKGAGRR